MNEDLIDSAKERNFLIRIWPILAGKGIFVVNVIAAEIVRN